MCLNFFSRSGNYYQKMDNGIQYLLFKIAFLLHSSHSTTANVLPYCMIFFLTEKMMNSVFLIDFICKRQRKRDREKMQATRMRRLPRPTVLCAAVPFSFTCNQFCRRHSMGRDAGFLFFFLFVYGFLYSLDAVLTQRYCVRQGEVARFLIQGAERITKVREKKSYENISQDFIVKNGEIFHLFEPTCH